MINLHNYQKFQDTELYFSKRDKKILEKMIGQEVRLISTVCPDYANDGEKYTFWGELGCDISFTMRQHHAVVPSFIKTLQKLGCKPVWDVLLADLTNVTSIQNDFLKKVAGSKKEYLRRCEKSAEKIQEMISDYGTAKTFSQFYEEQGIDYLSIQEKTAKNIFDYFEHPKFKSKFESFLIARKPLSEKLWGKKLKLEEQRIAAAHGISLYATHGTLLRDIYKNENFIFINHCSPNLKNLFHCNFVDEYEHLQDHPKFPLGLVSGVFY